MTQRTDGMEVVDDCPVIEPSLRHAFIMFKWPDWGWCVGQITKAERKVAKDGYNATVKYPESRNHYRHLLAATDKDGVLRYTPAGDGPDLAWVLLRRSASDASQRALTNEWCDISPLVQPLRC